MAKPENRWQLLLVADDGRIIPFKRVKGLVVTLVVLLGILALACTVLGWLLTAEKVRHRGAKNRLADANRLVAQYKSKHELTTAELVLAQARLDLGDGLALEWGGAYLFTGDFYASPGAGSPDDLYELFSRFQFEF